MSKKRERNRTPAKAQPQRVQVGEASTVHQSHMAVKHEQWMGPLPHPDQLARFDEILPGCADRIVRMAEQEGEHSREVQMRAVKGAVVSQYLGQAFALIITCGGLWTTYKLAMAGHDGVAMIVAGTTITVVAGALLEAKKIAKKKQSPA